MDNEEKFDMLIAMVGAQHMERQIEAMRDIEEVSPKERRRILLRAFGFVTGTLAFEKSAGVAWEKMSEIKDADAQACWCWYTALLIELCAMVRKASEDFSIPLPKKLNA